MRRLSAVVFEEATISRGILLLVVVLILFLPMVINGGAKPC